MSKRIAFLGIAVCFVLSLAAGRARATRNAAAPAAALGCSFVDIVACTAECINAGRFFGSCIVEGGDAICICK